MADTLFDTPEKKANATIYFQQLQVDPGWLLVKEIVEANVRNIQQQLEDPDSDDTLEEVRMKRRLLRFYRKVSTMPQDMIKSFSSEAVGIDPNLDPFFPTPEVKPKKR